MEAWQAPNQGHHVSASKMASTTSSGHVGPCDSIHHAALTSRRQTGRLPFPSSVQRRWGSPWFRAPGALPLVHHANASATTMTATTIHQNTTDSPESVGLPHAMPVRHGEASRRLGMVRWPPAWRRRQVRMTPQKLNPHTGGLPDRKPRLSNDAGRLPPRQRLSRQFLLPCRNAQCMNMHHSSSLLSPRNS